MSLDVYPATVGHERSSIRRSYGPWNWPTALWLRSAPCSAASSGHSSGSLLVSQQAQSVQYDQHGASFVPNHSSRQAQILCKS